MSRLLALYPERWRNRYGDEFLALLADRPPAFRDRIDIVRGAVDAHLSPQLAGPERVSDRVGFGALAGFGLFCGAIVIAANGPEHFDSYGSYRDGAAAMPVFLLAMALLALALFRVIDRLPRAQDQSRAIGLIALACGLVWAVAPWVLPAMAIFLVGVVVVARGAYRAGLWPRWLPILVTTLGLFPILFGLATLFLPWYAMRQAGVNFLIVFVPISGMWLAYGFGLLRGFPRVAEPS